MPNQANPQHYAGGGTGSKNRKRRAKNAGRKQMAEEPKHQQLTLETPSPTPLLATVIPAATQPSRTSLAAQRSSSSSSTLYRKNPCRSPRSSSPEYHDAAGSPLSSTQEPPDDPSPSGAAVPRPCSNPEQSSRRASSDVPPEPYSLSAVEARLLGCLPGTILDDGNRPAAPPAADSEKPNVQEFFALAHWNSAASFSAPAVSNEHAELVKFALQEWSDVSTDDRAVVYSSSKEVFMERNDKKEGFRPFDPEELHNTQKLKKLHIK